MNKVIIPRSNVVNLLLDEAVVNAGRRFIYIYAVDDVDQALSLLSGTVAGSMDEQQAFPEGSINALVVELLTQYCGA